jgi:hypothetical protein
MVSGSRVTQPHGQSQFEGSPPGFVEDTPVASGHAAQTAPPPTWSPLTPEQIAPYVAFQGTRATILAEESSACGQRGRVCRVFWRQEEPWVVLRCQNGLLLSLPWHWTDLPIPLAPLPGPPAQPYLALLTPQALVELVQFVRYHAGKPRSPRRGEKGGTDDSRARGDSFLARSALPRRGFVRNLIHHLYVARPPCRPFPSPALAPAPKPLHQARRHRLQATGRNSQPKPLSSCSPSSHSAMCRLHGREVQTHEYSSHHHSSSRADGLRLRAPIHPVASE